MDHKPGTTTQPPTHRWRLAGVATVIAVIAVGVLYALVSAHSVRQNTSTITIDTPHKKAKISIGQLGVATQTIGTGNVSVRLRPGVYQITAATENGGVTSKVIQVVKDKAQTISLTGEEPIEIHKIANYRAEGIFVADNTLYFLNLNEHVPYVYELGSNAGRPFLASLSDIRSLHWISPTQLVTEGSNGVWLYTTNNQSTPITYGNKPPESISFNNTDTMVLIGQNKDIALTPSIEAQPQKIGTVANVRVNTSVAPDGSVLVYTPKTNSQRSGDRTRLFKNGAFSTLPPDLTGIADVAWNTDSTAFSYTTNRGRFIYNIADKSITQFTVGIPTDPKATLWVSPRALIYAHEGAVWRYDTSAKVSIKLADLKGNLSVATPFTLAPDGKTVYFSTSSGRDNKSGGIYSIIPTYRSMPASDQKSMDEQQQRAAQADITYSGINMFIQNGLTSDQTETFKFALGQYAKQHDMSIKTVHLSDFSMDLRPGPVDIVRFMVTINDSTRYRARMDITDISAVRLFLTDDKTGAQVFDSGTIHSQ